MMNNRNSVINQLFEASFAVDDVILYLDTHPNDKNALQYYQNAAACRMAAKREYEAQCGPLTVDQVDVSQGWKWEQGPWPWEGGNQ